jgi:hypothetical protein
VGLPAAAAVVVAAAAALKAICCLHLTPQVIRQRSEHLGVQLLCWRQRETRRTSCFCCWCGAWLLLLVVLPVAPEQPPLGWGAVCIPAIIIVSIQRCHCCSIIRW